MRKAFSNTPLTYYHSVPVGWAKAEVLSSEYQSFRSEYKLDTSKVTKPGAPSWMPDRYNWLRYKHMLYEVAKGVRARDGACIELAVRYIELNHFGSYSGFIRTKLAKSLLKQKLSMSQKERLCIHFKRLIRIGQCFHEFRQYKKLMKKWG